MESANELWALVHEDIKANITEVVYEVWMSNLQLVSFDGLKAVLATDSFRRKIIEQKFLKNINESFERVTGFEVEVELTDLGVDTAPAPGSEKENSFNEKDEENTFDTFVIGPSNRFAHAAAIAVAANPGEDTNYNPLFIYGKSGLGKTHLMNAIKHEVLKNDPDKQIIFTRGEDFVNLIVDGIQNHKMQAIHEKYRKADLLLVDDIQFLSGKEQTQEEFFHTFEALYAANKQIVLTSDRPPKDIADIVDRLRNRFEWGLIADIQPPDLETRIAIINRKAESLDIEIPADVANYIAANIKNNVRQLEGAVKKLKAIVTFHGGTINLVTAQSAIKDILATSTPTPVTIDRIIDEVARTYGGSASDIRSKKRDARSTQMRQMAMYLVREMTGLSSTDIGKHFDNRDHATVLYSLREIEKKLKKDSSLRTTLEDIRKNVEDK